MANVEWLIAGGLLALGLAIGLGIGLFISRKTGKVRDLQDQLKSTQSELDDYREQVVTQFSETAHKFKTLNDAYVDLHQQLASSASALCGNAAGPLLEAPGSVETLIATETADEPSTEPQAQTSAASEEAGPVAEEVSDEVSEAGTEAAADTEAEQADATKTADADAGNDILVPEPSQADNSENAEPLPEPEPAEPRKYGAGS